MKRDHFKGLRWGIFMHYLAIPASTNALPGELNPANWNRNVDAFRADKLAAQLHRAGAQYMFLTLGQNSGYYCAPNAALDRIVGRNAATSRCSRRDLVADLAAELDKYGIKLFVYLPSHAPMSDAEAVKKLGFVAEWDFSQWSPPNLAELQAAGTDPDPRLSRGQRNYEAVIREWSDRWGSQVNGWWFDGCYYYKTMYQRTDEPNFHSFAAAARSGNPGSMVTFNCGVLYPPVSISGEEDYSAGEVVELDKVLEHGLDNLTGLRRHILTYAGSNWGRGRLRFDGPALKRYTDSLNQMQAVISWDVPFNPADGTLSDEVLEALSFLK